MVDKLKFNIVDKDTEAPFRRTNISKSIGEGKKK